MIPKVSSKPSDEEPETPTGPLFATFSTAAAEGAGLKSRRLSASLPDEFHVDSCELNDEFKSTSFLPGKRGNVIGKGATATVTLMCRKDGPKDELYAVKEFRRRDNSEREGEYIKKLQSEYTIAKSLRHPNIVTTVRLCTHAGRWNHVMEYCSAGEMYSLVEKGLFKTHYKLEDRLCFFKQLIRGVDYLHSHGIAHRDIKLENLLMDKNGHVKITDFGVSEVFSGEHPGLDKAGGRCGKNMGAIRLCSPGICGSLPYIAPEVLEKAGPYDPRPLDVWSCAIVFLTMTYSGTPWQAARLEHDHYERFLNGWTTWLENHPDGVMDKDDPDGVPKCGPLFAHLDTAPLKRIILKMLHPIPDKRSTIRDVLNSASIKAIDCCSMESYEGECCVDASGKLKSGKKVLKKHSHLPPKEHKTPRALQHRFDMGHGYNNAGASWKMF